MIIFFVYYAGGKLFHFFGDGVWAFWVRVGDLRGHWAVFETIGLGWDFGNIDGRVKDSYFMLWFGIWYRIQYARRLAVVY